MRIGLLRPLSSTFLPSFINQIETEHLILCKECVYISHVHAFFDFIKKNQGFHMVVFNRRRMANTRRFGVVVVAVLLLPTVMLQ